jgi:hypothetical protein
MLGNLKTQAARRVSAISTSAWSEIRPTGIENTLCHVSVICGPAATVAEPGQPCCWTGGTGFRERSIRAKGGCGLTDSPAVWLRQIRDGWHERHQAMAPARENLCARRPDGAGQDSRACTLR